LRRLKYSTCFRRFDALDREPLPVCQRDKFLPDSETTLWPALPDLRHLRIIGLFLFATGGWLLAAGLLVYSV
jgi:hypothetical protein